MIGPQLWRLCVGDDSGAGPQPGHDTGGQASGYLKNTVVMFLSDHGPATEEAIEQSTGLTREQIRRALDHALMQGAVRAEPGDVLAYRCTENIHQVPTTTGAPGLVAGGHSFAGRRSALAAVFATLVLALVGASVWAAARPPRDAPDVSDGKNVAGLPVASEPEGDSGASAFGEDETTPSDATRSMEYMLRGELVLRDGDGFDCAQPTWCTDHWSDSSGSVDDYVRSREGVSCSGDGGYSDIRAGADVVLRGGDGSVLASGRLSEGEARHKETQLNFTMDDGEKHYIVNFDCVLTFRLSDIPAEEFYELSVSHRGSVMYTMDEFEEQRWNIQISIG